MAAELGPLVAAWCGDGDLADAVWQVASLYALDGRSLQSLLDDLDGASAALGLTGADRALERSLAVAWSEAALGRFSQLRCTDPMTGLATVQHLQTEVAGLCRRGTSRDWSLVVVEVGRRGQDDPNVPAGLLESFGLSEVARVVDRELLDAQVVARLTLRRLAVTVPGRSAVDVVERIERRWGIRRIERGGGPRVWCWIERLPEQPGQAASLIDELCR